MFPDRERCQGVSLRNISETQRLEVALYQKERCTPDMVQRYTLGVRFRFQRIEVGEKVLNQPHTRSGKEGSKFKVLAGSDW